MRDSHFINDTIKTRLSVFIKTGFEFYLPRIFNGGYASTRAGAGLNIEHIEPSAGTKQCCRAAKLVII